MSRCTSQQSRGERPHAVALQARLLRRARSRPSAVLARALLLAALAASTGCEDRRAVNRYSVLAGKVVTCHPDTGELTVRVSQRTPAGPAEKTIYCLVTRDSEIYVNDKVSSLREIQLGDAVELVGHQEPGSRPRRFVISFAYFDHPLPPPPPPLELTPTSTPAAPDQTDQREQREE